MASMNIRGTKDTVFFVVQVHSVPAHAAHMANTNTEKAARNVYIVARLHSVLAAAAHTENTKDNSLKLLVPSLSLLLFPFRLQPGAVLWIKEFGPIAAAGLPETAPAFRPGRIPGVLAQQNVYFVVVCYHFETFRFLTIFRELGLYKQKVLKSNQVRLPDFSLPFVS
ncbi:MAG: hypothetical protein MUO31_13955, partial [Thermodesulfovibrionales bacterium]|nr:hypothetical protein [Thermodesulfovibrionales bacterium]